MADLALGVVKGDFLDGSRRRQARLMVSDAEDVTELSSILRYDLDEVWLARVRVLGGFSGSFHGRADLLRQPFNLADRHIEEFANKLGLPVHNLVECRVVTLVLADEEHTIIGHNEASHLHLESAQFSALLLSHVA